MANDICLVYNITDGDVTIVDMSEAFGRNETAENRLTGEQTTVQKNKYIDLRPSKYIEKWMELEDKTTFRYYKRVSLSNDSTNVVKLSATEINTSGGFVIRMDQNKRLEKIPVSKKDCKNLSQAGIANLLITTAENKAMEAKRRIGVAVKFSACSKKANVAVKFSACSEKALQWAVANVARKGDHLILVNIKHEGDSKTRETDLISFVGLSNPRAMRGYGVNPDAETLKFLTWAAGEKGMEVSLKIDWGDAREKLCESIDKIPLDCIVIGNRGLDMGSVSNHVANKVSCPVTVVKNMERA